MALIGQNDSQKEGNINYIFPCTPQGGKVSFLYHRWYNTEVYLGGIYNQLIAYILLA